MKLSDDARQAIHDRRWGPHIKDPIERQEADDRVIKKIMDTFNRLESELHNAQVRISDRDLKIERQREQLNKLEASRKGLKTESAAIKNTAGELAIMLWGAIPPNETSEENAALKKYVAHKPECTHWEPFAGDPSYVGCSCGLDALLTTED